MFEIVKTSERLKNNWTKYQNRYSFAEDITYADIMEKIELVVRLLEREIVNV